MVCRVLRVNRSTFYKFLKHRESEHEKENKYIKTCIVEIYARTNKRLGAAKTAICLSRDYRINISVGRVYRLMKTMNLPKMSTTKPHFKRNTAEIGGKCENILKQNFDQPQPNLVWVSDFTYIKAANRNYYLCAIMDLFSRKIIAYKVSSKIDTKLAIETLNLAISDRGVSLGVVFHTDRGSQFTSKDFRQYLDNLGMIQSFSAKGHPYDNAVMECFFKYLKKEETDRRHFSSVGELELALFKYINGFYNSIRPHSHNNGLSPSKFENDFFKFL